MNREGIWTLKKKDERGKFFILMPAQGCIPVSILKYGEDKEEVDFLKCEPEHTFLENEINFV